LVLLLIPTYQGAIEAAQATYS